jgi:hypothetical protein
MWNFWAKMNQHTTNAPMWMDGALMGLGFRVFHPSLAQGFFFGTFFSSPPMLV